MPFIAIALVIAAALGGGTAAVAQASLPGDVLWGFKINVNEALSAALAPSFEAKANADIAAINTRLAEAQTLEQKGELDADAQADISANLSLHEDAVRNAILQLQAEGNTQAAATVAARYQSTVSAQVAPMASSAIVAQVRGALDAASSLSANANTAATANATVNIGL